MKIKNRTNYLHYRDSLDRLINLDFDAIKRLQSKSELKKELVSNYGFEREFISNVFACYKLKQAPFLKTFEKDVQNSVEYRCIFKKLGYRGFSYEFDSNIELVWPKMRDGLGLAMGITCSEDLFYPKKVKDVLKKSKLGHWGRGNYPSIAFALGQISETGWFIFILQSDLMFSSSSLVRDHFRGWRKLLMNKIINEAKGNTNRLFLCPASGVLATCKSRSRPDVVPNSWNSIYDRTAIDFGMRKIQLAEEVDIQCFAREESIYQREFFVLDI